jgi:hypothetical protein
MYMDKKMWYYYYFLNDGLTYHTSKNEKWKIVMCIGITKYKAKLRIVSRIASTSSYLVLLKEFGPFNYKRQCKKQDL